MLTFKITQETANCLYSRKFISNLYFTKLNDKINPIFKNTRKYEASEYPCHLKVYDTVKLPLNHHDVVMDGSKNDCLDSIHQQCYFVPVTFITFVKLLNYASSTRQVLSPSKSHTMQIHSKLDFMNESARQITTSSNLSYKLNSSNDPISRKSNINYINYPLSNEKYKSNNLGIYPKVLLEWIKNLFSFNFLRIPSLSLADYLNMNKSSQTGQYLGAIYSSIIDAVLEGLCSFQYLKLYSDIIEINSSLITQNFNHGNRFYGSINNSLENESPCTTIDVSNRKGNKIRPINFTFQSEIVEMAEISNKYSCDRNVEHEDKMMETDVTLPLLKLLVDSKKLLTELRELPMLGRNSVLRQCGVKSSPMQSREKNQKHLKVINTLLGIKSKTTSAINLRDKINSVSTSKQNSCDKNKSDGAKTSLSREDINKSKSIVDRCNNETGDKRNIFSTFKQRNNKGESDERNTVQKRISKEDINNSKSIVDRCNNEHGDLLYTSQKVADVKDSTDKLNVEIKEQPVFLKDVKGEFQRPTNNSTENKKTTSTAIPGDKIKKFVNFPVEFVNKKDDLSETCQKIADVKDSTNFQVEINKGKRGDLFYSTQKLEDVKDLTNKENSIFLKEQNDNSNKNNKITAPSIPSSDKQPKSDVEEEKVDDKDTTYSSNSTTNQLYKHFIKSVNLNQAASNVTIDYTLALKQDTSKNKTNKYQKNVATKWQSTQVMSPTSNTIQNRTQHEKTPLYKGTPKKDPKFVNYFKDRFDKKT